MAGIGRSLRSMKISIIYYSETGNTEKMAALIELGCHNVDEIEARRMPVDGIDSDFVEQSKAVIFGSPTHGASSSWQLKKCIQELDRDATTGKLGAVFVSQNWPGGGGASFAEMNIIAILLVRGMLVYSGGLTASDPANHFGAVSWRAPEEDLYIQRCVVLGENIAKKAIELFG